MTYSTSTTGDSIDLQQKLDDDISNADIKWAMALAVQALQGSAMNVENWDAYCNKVAEGAMYLLGTKKMIENEYDV
ncbi:MAG: hypothetical protein Unbinned1446contig1005_35 [Prokaryotic dsDNA virus sp.]|nr:MAG: hypothetical protein Unbinned1446contig1005_35 [Prokaryotic dsDNA virus sp.]|tara:strand:+ start:6627 stop:6854 length:228 start_codon:yes stop_codon:yes gene_type:complete